MVDVWYGEVFNVTNKRNIPFKGDIKSVISPFTIRRRESTLQKLYKLEYE
ncbi:hypothetical protein SAMN04488055_3386 [Chitinophaga niabensis]|uniref:Uncharacterized protein n=1 Tax=Chitinophaga niabensis TaxID=536979 RepID=A0A1N6HHP6_9BACT|nr:hypothetical protein SAMN04488055_3386 [Chitinophaga niabensis]